MKLSEKICYCRKKKGQSQEALAEQLEVSRQAVSKWELGESEPDVGRLRLLAEIFQVSVDWLLSEEDPVEEGPQQTKPGAAAKEAPLSLEAFPGVLGKLVRKYGWLAGILLSLWGGFLALMGGLARFVSQKMFMGIEETFGSEALSHNPVYLVGGFLLLFGLIVAAAGVILALFLKKKSK